MRDDARALFALAAERQGLPIQLEDPAASDRVALLITSARAEEESHD